MSSTANNHRIGLSAAGALVLTAAAFGVAAPAHAEPTFCDPSSPFYVADSCAAWRRGAEQALLPTTTPPATTSGSGGITGWIDSHIGLLICLGLVVFGFFMVRSMLRENAEEKATVNAAALARGRRLASDHHAEQVAAARAAAAAQLPPRETWDPHGLGLAPPPMPKPDLPAPPPTSDADLRRYAAFGWVIPFVPGTAFAAVVARDGSIARAESAWAEAAELAGVGETDPESGKFTAAATVVNVNGATDDSGDVLVSVDTRDYSIGAQQLDRVLPHLVRTARVATASKFERDPASDRFTTRLSMNNAAASTAHAPTETVEPEQPRVDPKWS